MADERSTWVNLPEDCKTVPASVLRRFQNVTSLTRAEVLGDRLVLSGPYRVVDAACKLLPLLYRQVKDINEKRSTSKFVEISKKVAKHVQRDRLFEIANEVCQQFNDSDSSDIKIKFGRNGVYIEGCEETVNHIFNMFKFYIDSLCELSGKDTILIPCPIFSYIVFISYS